MRAIVETESPSYLLHRAQELLRDADNTVDRCEHYESVSKAISLLGLHLVKDELRTGHTPRGTRKKCKSKPMVARNAQGLEPNICGGQGID